MNETTHLGRNAARMLLASLFAVGSLLPLTLLVPEVARGDDSSADKPGWIGQIADHVKGPLADVEGYAEVRWQEFANKMGFRKARHIAAYRGYGNGEKIWVQGRLLANKPYGGPREDDNWWDNLKATYERWESDEISGAEIHLTYVDERQTVTTDEEGYYTAEFSVDPGFPRTAVVTAEHRGDGEVLNAHHDILVRDPAAQHIVISDVDDTVIHTGITNLLTSARLTFLHNARTRKPLIGVDTLYRYLASEGSQRLANPVIYVSNSAWNMYDLLRDFMDLNDMPTGPLLLRDLGFGTDTSDHKIETIARLVRRFDPLPVILVGDSGQHDAEIYAQIAEQYPGRVRAIYIRDVDPSDDSENDAKVDRIIERDEVLDDAFLRVNDSGEIARHLQRLDMLDADAVRAIEAAVETDRERDTLAEEVMDGDGE